LRRQCRLRGGIGWSPTARDPAAFDDLVARGDHVLPLALDVTDPRAADEARAQGRRDVRPAHVLVNNADTGNMGPSRSSLEDFRAQIETNLFGSSRTKAAFRCCAHKAREHLFRFVRRRPRRGDGAAPYSAAKWSVRFLGGAGQGDGRVA